MAGVRTLKEYPFQDGDTVVLGPEVFVSSDGTVICFRGENYYVPTMTPGRVLYERWLAAKDVSPDDLWDHSDPHDRIAWEALASGGSGEVPAGLTPEHVEALVANHDQRGPREGQVYADYLNLLGEGWDILRAALRGSGEPPEGSGGKG